ncbi:IMP dehydrogenase, partial [Streptococcus sobrinus]
MENVFDYEDIQLIPAKCIVDSRSECDTSVTLGGHTFKLPVVPANMQTIIDENIAAWLAENGYFYIMHRFEPEKRLAFVRDMKVRGLISSISVG